MAQFVTILIPEPGNAQTATVASGAASAAIAIARNKKFTVTAVDANLAAVPFHLAVGDASVTVSTSNDLYLPGKYTLQTGHEWTYVRIHNPTSANLVYYVAQMANA